MSRCSSPGSRWAAACRSGWRETQGDRVSGLVVVNPSLAGDSPLIPFTPVLKYLVRSVPSIGGDIKKPDTQEGAAKRTPVASVATLPAMWKTTVAELASVTQPVLVYRSTEDHVVGPASMKVADRRAACRGGPPARQQLPRRDA